jgi:hypothetical protein
MTVQKATERMTYHVLKGPAHLQLVVMLLLDVRYHLLDGAQELLVQVVNVQDEHKQHWRTRIVAKVAVRRAVGKLWEQAARKEPAGASGLGHAAEGTFEVGLGGYLLAYLRWWRSLEARFDPLLHWSQIELWGGGGQMSRIKPHRQAQRTERSTEWGGEEKEGGGGRCEKDGGRYLYDIREMADVGAFGLDDLLCDASSSMVVLLQLHDSFLLQLLRRELGCHLLRTTRWRALCCRIPQHLRSTIKFFLF